MSLLQALALGIVQGLTEFLPVSSSAHLILARVFLGLDAGQLGLAFDVACHVGTLAAVVAYFRSDLRAMLRASPQLLRAGSRGPAHLLRLVSVGTLPVVIVGLAAIGVIESRLRTPAVAAAMLAAGALLFFVAERLGARRREAETLGFGEALGIGAAQAFALVPGVSRSGATIALAMLLGLKREAAARFSFLLGVPAIVAAAGHEALALAAEGLSAADALRFAIGTIASGIVGYLAIKYLLRYLSGHTLAVFAWYRLALAAALAVWWWGGWS
ncbi:MAG: undecaprenyl-diphosphate phosphatase [Acidobacteriota bacterium]